MRVVELVDDSSVDNELRMTLCCYSHNIFHGVSGSTQLYPPFQSPLRIGN